MSTTAAQATPNHLSLPLGDINVVVVTDVHSWVAGHARHGEPFDANYGDVVSFYRHLQSHPSFRAEARDLFFVMNGDFVDGTGLSTVPPEHLTPILQQMPWDAVNIGNHELYHNETVQFLTESGFVSHWSGGFLTSNVLLEATREPIGARYVFLQGRNSCVLAFGFLYNFLNNCKMTIVERVQDVVQQEWFRSVLVNGKYDAILVMAHMDCVDPIVSVILESIRLVIGSGVPIQFVTGHSHRRCFEAIDASSTSMEAGRFLDTIGFVSFPTQRTLASWNASNARMNLFRYSFIEASKHGLSQALGFEDSHRLSTPEGLHLASFIRRSQRELHLNDHLGCSPVTFTLDADFSDPKSLWGLYLMHVVPTELLRRNASQLFVQRTGAFRYALFEGEITEDDIIAVCPFDDAIYEVAHGIQGAIMIEVVDQLSRVRDGEVTPLAAFPILIEPDTYYSVYSPDWNMPEVLDRISYLTGKTYSPAKLVGVSTTDLWRRFVRNAWPTCKAATEFKAASTFHSQSKASGDPERLQVMFGAVAGVVLLVLLVARMFTVRTTRESLSRMMHSERHYGSF